LHSKPRKSKCNLRILGGIIQYIPLWNFPCEKKKSNCYTTVQFRLYTKLKSYLVNKKLWNRIIIQNSESFHFGPNNHQNINKEFITSSNNNRQLKTFYCKQRKSKCTLTILFMMGQLKIYSYEICTLTKKTKMQFDNSRWDNTKYTLSKLALWKEKIKVLFDNSI